MGGVHAAWPDQNSTLYFCTIWARIAARESRAASSGWLASWLMPTMTVSVAGSGNVVFGGVAGSLTARIAGSGDVRARQVRGQVRKTVMGSGAVRIG